MRSCEISKDEESHILAPSTTSIPRPWLNSSSGRRNNYPPRDDRPDRRDADRDRGGRGFSRDRDRQGSGAPSGSGYGGAGAGGQRPRRDNRAIAERIELERQCRTLFVRNISVSLSARHNDGSAPGRQEPAFPQTRAAEG